MGAGHKRSHAYQHVEGEDAIQPATPAQPGLMSAAQAQSVEDADTHAGLTNNPHATDLGNLGAGTVAELNAVLSDLIPTYGGVRDIGVGTLAQRPAASVANRFFYTTDELNLYYDNGVTWDTLQVLPDLHAASHSDGGSDEITVENLATVSVDVSQALRPDGLGGLVFGDVAHSDLTGIGTDDHHARDHAATHITGGADAIQLATAGQDGLMSQAYATKLDGIEALADVTDSVNVDAAGAVMNTDTTTAAMAFVIDEDDMVSDLATKVPTQQSVKAYVDASVVSSLKYQGGYDASAVGPNGSAVKGWLYVVTVTGTGGGYWSTALEVGDQIFAEIDNPLTEADWTRVSRDYDAASIKASYESNADTNAFTDTEKTNLGTLTAGADTTLHYHDTDRNRANHTGTQLAATISDFTTTVQAVTFPYLKLDTAAGDPGHIEGILFYDNVNKALGFYNDETESTAQIPYEDWFRCRNTTGVTITNGQAVYQGPVDSGIPTVLLAKADAKATSDTLKGLATHDLETASNGIIVGRGTLRGYNTSGFVSGEALWLSATVAGGITNVRPSLPYRAIRVGVAGIIDAVNGTIEVDIGTPETQNTDEILFSDVHDHINNLADVIDHIWSPGGCASGFALTDNLNGTVAVAAGSAVLRTTDSPHGHLEGFAVGAVNPLSLTDNATNYIMVDYNGGSPQIIATADLVNDVLGTRLKTLIYAVNRLGNDLSIVDLRSSNVDYIRKNSVKDYLTHGIEHSTGSLVADEGTLQFSVTAGTYYILNNQFTLPALDTSAAGTFEYVYRDGVGGWTRVAAQSAIDDDKYDDGTGVLATIDNNKYGVHFLYGVINIPGHYKMVYGTAQYATLSDAQAASTPAILPSDLDSLSTAVLIAKIIVQKGSSTLNDIQSPFEKLLRSTTATVHNGLSGLQGGALNEYYHMTAAEYTAVKRTATPTVQSKTGTYTTQASDDILELNGTFTLTMHTPSAPRWMWLKNLGGTQTISGVADLDFLYEGESATLYYSGTAWRVM